MEEIKQVLEEFHSVVRPFRNVQILLQSPSKFNLLAAVTKLNEAFQNLYLAKADVRKQAVRARRQGSAPRTGKRLDPHTCRVIKMMRKGLTRR
jgi:hypothetical protein